VFGVFFTFHNLKQYFKKSIIAKKIFHTVGVMILQDMLTPLKLTPLSEMLLAENLRLDVQRLYLPF